MKKVFLNLMLLLCALIVGTGSLWGANGDIHDMGITQSTQLNNSAAIPTIQIAEQSYYVKKVTINYRHNKDIDNPVTISVSVNGNSWGSKNITKNTTADIEFEGSSVKGAIEISFTNNSGSGTGKGTLWINSVKLTEGVDGSKTNTSLSLLPNSLDLSYGGSAETLTATVTPTDEAALNNPIITWATNDETVATVSNGVVSPVGAGSCKISATFAGDNSYNGSSDTAIVTVTDNRTAAVSAITSINSIKGLYIGGKHAFIPVVTLADGINESDVTYSYVSADPATIQINDDGTYTALKTGTNIDITVTVTPIAAKLATHKPVSATFKHNGVYKYSKPLFTPTGVAEGNFIGSMTLAIANDGTVGPIYYTLDGVDPATDKSNGTLYSDELTLTETKTVKARVIDNEGYYSTITTANYTLITPKTPTFSEQFTSSLGDFTVTPDATLGNLWSQTSGAAKASAYVNSTQNAGESWLLSPYITLGDYMTLSFNHADQYFNSETEMKNECTLWIREFGEDWEQLTIATYPSYTENTKSSFATTTNRLSSYSGKNVQIGFKYLGNTTHAGSWFVDNFSVGDVRTEAPISFSEATVYKAMKDKDTYEGQVLTNSKSLAVSYESDNTSVAIVNASTGVVSIKGVGEANISATYEESEAYKAKTVSYKLVVAAKAAAEIEFAEASIEKKITAGTYTQTLTNPNSLTVAYSSSEPTVATVNEFTGEVTLLKAGETTIYATFTADEDYDGAVVNYTLTVVKDNAGISYSDDKVSAAISTNTYKQTLTNPNSLDITYSSTNPSVGTIASDGTVTLVKPGKTIIYAYFDGNNLYEASSVSYTLTVTADYATLPFSFNSGKSAIPNTDGLSHSGLGSDYSATNTKLKFDDASDYLVLKINETPGTLMYSIKSNSFSGGTFKVQESSDGSSYTDVKSYINSFSDVTETITNLKESTRYIKWVYTSRSSGNVGLGNIKLDPKYVMGSISSLGWSTLSSSKVLDFTGITEINAYLVTAVDGSNLTLTKVTGTVPANTGLLISGTANTTVNIPVTANSSTDVSANLLKPGNDASVAYDANSGYNYVLAADEGDAVFKRIVEGASAVVPKGKAYLSLTANPNPNPDAPSIIRFVEEENNATSIEVIGSDDKAIKFFENGQIYILREGVVYDALGRIVK